MDSNTYSNQPPEPLEPLEDPELLRLPEELAGLATDIDQLTSHDLDHLPDLVRAQRLQALRQLSDRLQGQWFKELAALDGRGAAATDPRCPTPSTASWLRRRLRSGRGVPGPSSDRP